MLLARSTRRPDNRCHHQCMNCNVADTDRPAHEELAQHGCPSCKVPHVDLDRTRSWRRMLKSAWPESMNSSPEADFSKAVGFRDPSEFLGNELPSLQGRLIVVLALVRSRGQLDLDARHLLEGNLLQDVGDAVESGSPLVVRSHDIPRHVLAIRLVQHLVTCARVVIPASVRLEIHRTQFPLSQRVVDACRETSLLLVLADLQPDLDQP